MEEGRCRERERQLAVAGLLLRINCCYKHIIVKPRQYTKALRIKREPKRAASKQKIQILTLLRTI